MYEAKTRETNIISSREKGRVEPCRGRKKDPVQPTWKAAEALPHWGGKRDPASSEGRLTQGRDEFKKTTRLKGGGRKRVGGGENS